MALRRIRTRAVNLQPQQQVLRQLQTLMRPQPEKRDNPAVFVALTQALNTCGVQMHMLPLKHGKADETLPTATVVSLWTKHLCTDTSADDSVKDLMTLRQHYDSRLEHAVWEAECKAAKKILTVAHMQQLASKADRQKNLYKATLHPSMEVWVDTTVDDPSNASKLQWQLCRIVAVPARPDGKLMHSDLPTGLESIDLGHQVDATAKNPAVLIRLCDNTVNVVEMKYLARPGELSKIQIEVVEREHAEAEAAWQEEQQRLARASSEAQLQTKQARDALVGKILQYWGEHADKNLALDAADSLTTEELTTLSDKEREETAAQLAQMCAEAQDSSEHSSAATMEADSEKTVEPAPVGEDTLIATICADCFSPEVSTTQLARRVREYFRVAAEKGRMQDWGAVTAYDFAWQLKKELPTAIAIKSSLTNDIIKDGESFKLHAINNKPQLTPDIIRGLGVILGDIGGIQAKLEKDLAHSSGLFEDVVTALVEIQVDKLTKVLETMRATSTNEAAQRTEDDMEEEDQAEAPSLSTYKKPSRQQVPTPMITMATDILRDMCGSEGKSRMEAKLQTSAPDRKPLSLDTAKVQDMGKFMTICADFTDQVCVQLETNYTLLKSELLSKPHELVNCVVIPQPGQVTVSQGRLARPHPPEGPPARAPST